MGDKILLFLFPRRVYRALPVLALTALLLGGCEGGSSKLRPIPNQVVEKLDDTISLSLSAKVDIVVVMDGSGSMANHQANVKQNIGAFVDELTKATYLDYRIAVIIAGCVKASAHKQYTLPCSEGHFHRSSDTELPPYFVRKGDLDEQLLLTSRLEVGINNDGLETFFSPVVKAITPPLNFHPSNRGFLRNNAYLIPIFITDTDDQSKMFSPEQFYETLLMLKGSRDLIIPYAALIPARFGRQLPPKCVRDSVFNSNGEPFRIEEFLRIAGGSFFNVCDADFGANLISMAQDLVSRVEPVIYLEDRPYVPSIRIFYGNEEVPNDFENGWVYDPQTNVIRLGKWLDLKGKRNLTFQISYIKANQF